MIVRKSFSLTAMLTLAIGGIGFPSAVHGASQINDVSLRGLQIGGATTLTITGGDLAPAPKLILGIPNVQVNVKEETPNRLTLEVTLPADAHPGVYSLRLARDSGISNAVAIGVDTLPQMPIKDVLDSLPAAVHGKIAGAAVAATKFRGVKGQRLVVDVEAKRLGGTLNPVVELLDARNVPLGWAQESVRLAGDARLIAQLPEDGEYTIKLHDAVYQATAPGHFRMKIGDLQFADHTFPMGVQSGQTGQVSLVGAGGAVVDFTAGEADGAQPAPLPSTGAWIGPAPPVFVSRLTETVEAEPGAEIQLLQAPTAVSGRISKGGEVDRYRIKVEPGKKYRFELIANRTGTPVDGVLTLQNLQGAQLARSDDRPGTIDPGFDYDVKAGEETLVAIVEDLLGRGGPDYVYRLEIHPLPLRDFELTTAADRVHVPRQGVALLVVDAVRKGYGGPISLHLDGVPDSALLSGASIPPGRTRTLLTVAADEQQPLSQSVVGLTGRAAQPNVDVVRAAQRPATPATQRQPWLLRDIGLAVTPSGRLQIAWQTSDTELPLGFSYDAKVKVQRRDAAGAVRLSLITSQIPPVIADGPDKGKPDVNRTIRFEGVPQIAADQTETAAKVLVPADLPAGPYDLVVKAELLSDDGQKVLATALTPSLRLNAVPPLRLELAGEPSLQAKSGEGETGTVRGVVHRLIDVDEPVTVSLVGLPNELPAPSIAVPPGKDEFELPVAFPFGSPLGELKDVKLAATAKLNGERLATSNQLPLRVTVVQGDPPPPPGPLYRVVEDESFFLALLYEGDAKADLEATDRFAGEAAVKVAANQKYRTKMPAWSFKITENPQEGEFRYLRFAWKKQGGENILLQLNVNGNWGPARGQAGPAYRYEAGPKPNPFNVAALSVSDKLPETWTLVTRDLFADFGEFTLTGIALTPGPGEYGLFDHVYLARSMDDFNACPAPFEPQPPLAVFEDESDFPGKLTDGSGQIAIDSQDKFAGSASIRVTPEQRFNPNLPGLGLKIRQNPGEGEYRYLRYAWKKKGGTRICLQINHDGVWGPTRQLLDKKFRYDAGSGPESYSASVRLQVKLPEDWQVVTRDLYADFGEFTFTGLALSPIDGEFALFDHIYLAKTPRDFDLVHPQAKSADAAGVANK